MNLDCLDNIITKDLAIDIDISNNKSWDLNTGLTVNSLYKHENAYSSDLLLYDFGLTGFDNGRTNELWGNLSLTTNDNYFKMYRVGYNEVQNSDYYEYTGATSTITYDGLDIKPIQSGDSNNYFELNGGYLQGFFKLYDFDYETLPSRYGSGITIETILNIYQNSSGIFYYMGTRSEDKYKPSFSGETEISGDSMNIDGVVTSYDNYLDSTNETTETKKSFRFFEDREVIKYVEPESINDLKNNVISFEITNDKRIGYKYIDENGFIVKNVSNTVISATGLTLITITFTPEYKIIDEDVLYCMKRRNGVLRFYVNGRLFWIVDKFPEFYFKELNNDPEKQIGVPYNISWGGGSFGLKNSFHYDFQSHYIYSGFNETYIDDNFNVIENPLQTNCKSSLDDVNLSGYSLTINDNTFVEIDECSGQETNMNVIEVMNTGSTLTPAFIKFENPITILSNRDYFVNLSLYDTGIFDRFAFNKISIIAYSYDTDITIVDESVYEFPHDHTNTWNNVMLKFRINDDINKANVYIGVLIESTNDFSVDEKIYIKDFYYKGSDILVKDNSKSNLIIENNFNNSFWGGIQKLRVYTNALNQSEVLHNALIESELNSDIVVNKGGRIIKK